MKTWNPAALAAWASGEALETIAVHISGPIEWRVWAGTGALPLGGPVFTGVGDQVGASVAFTGAKGAAEQGLTLSLGGLDPKVLDMVPLTPWKRAPAVIYRLVFSGAGTVLLDWKAHHRGRIDDLWREDTPGGVSSILAVVEGAARGLGRSRGRMRTDSDQRLIDPNDGGFRHVTYAGEKKLQLGGNPPTSARGGGGGGPLGGGGSDFDVRV